MAATKAQMNWASVSFGSTAITRVTNGSSTQGGKLLKFLGDTDVFTTIIANVSNEPRRELHHGRCRNHHGNRSRQHQHALGNTQRRQGRDGSAVVFTMINAVFENADTKAAHAQLGFVTGTWQAYSSDGTTSPLSFARQ